MKIDYRKYLRSPEWKSKREELFKLRGKKCEMCGSTEKIHVHHLTYERIGDETMQDLQVLCEKHHMEQHPKWNSLKTKKYLNRKNDPLIEEEGEYMTLTSINIDMLRTPKGGIHKAMIEFLYPNRKRPPKGWLKKCIGMRVPKKGYDEVRKIVESYGGKDYYANLTEFGMNFVVTGRKKRKTSRKVAKAMKNKRKKRVLLGDYSNKFQ